MTGRATFAALGLAFALALGLAGCGQKGPLYLPDDEQAAERYAPQDAEPASDAPSPETEDATPATEAAPQDDES